MLKEALKARLPLIVCQTTDVVYARAIIHHLAGLPVLGKSTWCQVVFGLVASRDYLGISSMNTRNEGVTVVVNPTEPIPEAFDAGEIPVPPRLVRKELGKFLSASKAAAMVPVMHGLTLKQVSAICKLSQAGYGNLTAETVAELRGRVTTTVPGVQLIQTNLPHYESEAQINKWLTDVGPFLSMNEVDPRLRPRGLLMAGIPGTGKTLSAKYIAGTLGIPLYRLDVGALQSKYVGESEYNMRRALEVIRRNDPCVMLIDEIEKLFNGVDDSGVTKNLLAGLLWWLQEHEDRVLTVMTTNDLKALPKELIREGRIDKVFEFKGCMNVEAYCDSLSDSLGVNGFQFNYHPFSKQDLLMGIPQAKLTGFVLNQAREYLLKNSS